MAFLDPKSEVPPPPSNLKGPFIFNRQSRHLKNGRPPRTELIEAWFGPRIPRNFLVLLCSRMAKMPRNRDHRLWYSLVFGPGCLIQSCSAIELAEIGPILWPNVSWVGHNSTDTFWPQLFVPIWPISISVFLTLKNVVPQQPSKRDHSFSAKCPKSWLTYATGELANLASKLWP